MKTVWEAGRIALLLGAALSLFAAFGAAQTISRGNGREVAALGHSSKKIVANGDFWFLSFDYPGADATRAMGINAQGDVVGSFDDANGTHGFIFENGRFKAFDVPASPSTQPKSSNARGEIVGFYFDADFNLHGFHLFRGEFKTIDIPFSIETRAEGINEAGTISGEYVDQQENEHGYLLRDGHFETIDVPDTFSTDIWSISDDGWLAGDYSSATTVLAYVRDKHGKFSTLAYPGAIANTARAINDLHEVVGRWDDASMPLTIPCSTQCHGFLWSKGEFKDVEFPGAVITVALGINNSGLIVGRYVDSSNNEHAFVAKRRAHSKFEEDDDAFSQFEEEETGH
jgi:probable HAF family extracellular repeat protein